VFTIGAMMTTFIFTIDVESRTHGDPNQDVLGILPGHRNNCGIELMMDMLEAQQVRATFFLNVYEIAKYGDEVMSRAARQIHARGHDLELHTHPRPMYRYYGISMACFEEQVAILKRGIAIVQGWTGKRVTAHRAGAFSANTDTLRAMERAGLLVDCSLSPGSRVRVPLVEEIGATNLAHRVGTTWEIPMTYFDQLRIGPWRSRRILDIEGNSLSEIKHVTRQAIRNRLPTVCILMHSFSFLRHGRPNRRVIRRFAALLEWLREQHDVQVGTVEETCQRLESGGISESFAVAVPSTGLWLTWTRALQSWNDGWKNFVVSLVGIACFAILILAGAYLGYALIPR
jgi:peptidoglycan/xylan/chitin deacetylase (PgdA/CDA1 family)